MDRLTRRMAEISRATETGDLSRAGQSLGVEVKRIERKRPARHELNAIEGDPVRKRSKRGGTTPSLASRPPLASPIQTPPSSDSQAALYAASWITPPDSRYPPPQAAHLAKVPSHFPLPEPRSSTPSRAKLVERPERLGSLATIAEEVNYVSMIYSLLPVIRLRVVQTLLVSCRTWEIKHLRSEERQQGSFERGTTNNLPKVNPNPCSNSRPRPWLALRFSILGSEVRELRVAT